MWPERSPSTWSATSIARSWSTPSTRCAARSATRYDFKNVTVDLQLGKEEITLLTDDEYRAAAVKDLIESKAIRRGLSLKIFDWGNVEPAGGSKVRQVIKLRRGLPEDLAKKISKLIRDDFPEVPRPDPGRRGAGQLQEQGRSAEGHRPPARGRGGIPGAAPVPELPMNTQGRGARIVMILIILALAFSFVVGAVTMPQ